MIYVGEKFMIGKKNVTKKTRVSPVKTSKVLAKKVVVAKDKQTRLDIFRAIATETGLRKSQVESVFKTTTQLIHAHLKKRGSGEFIIPMTGVKIKRIRKKPTKAREMVSPLTNQKVLVKAKPSRAAVKIVALQSLKSALEG
jgi:nucleoid DNA-binding protein